MKKIIIEIVCGILFATIGFVLFALLMRYVSGSDGGIFSDFSNTIRDYFSVFSYGLGVAGAIFGAISLIELIGMFFWSGFWISERFFLDFFKK
ncbi:MAG: hypothetical protein LBR52_03040 [Prevotellaceae bacterium]|jgi:hypothetical protein|nr:hypothetical protein [Prevotellaceae bacterium]